MTNARARLTLAQARPDVAAQWHPTKNGDLTPNDVAPMSSKKRWWQCELGHEWCASPELKGSGCPFCTNRRVLIGYNDAATKAPHLIDEWHPIKNGDRELRDFVSGSNQMVWWQCPSCHHEWRTSVHQRMSNTGCPKCMAVRCTPGVDDFATLHPALAAQWHRAKNGDHRPDQFTSGSQFDAWWRCDLGHEWCSRICARTAGSQCPTCTGHGRSQVEVALERELARRGHHLADDSRLAVRWGSRHHSARCDIVLPDERTVIEYDGEYWHRNKQAIDRKKTRALLDAGWRVVRIREQPLDGLNIEHEHYREISWKYDLLQVSELADLVEAALVV